jgi:hypothetical protein
MEEVVVKRTGKPPLRFKGKLLADGDCEIVAGKERARWFSVRVYRLSDGYVVVAITYHSQFVGESKFTFAERWPLDDLESAFQFFEGEFYPTFNSWNRVNPKCCEEWEWLTLELKQLCGNMCEACGVVENLDALKGSETENGD